MMNKPKKKFLYLEKFEAYEKETDKRIRQIKKLNILTGIIVLIEIIYLLIR